MKLKYLISCVFVLVIGLAGCQSEEEAAEGSGDEDVVLVLVDGEPITLPMLERVMADRGVEENDHEAMREILDELIRVRAAANAAVAEGLDQEPEVQAEIALREMDSLYRRYMEKAEGEHEITESDIERVYRQQRERAGDTRYQIETIAYTDTAQALSDLARLEDELADWDSVLEEAESAERGVERPGWIDRSQVPEEFASALAETQSGEIVPVPLEMSESVRIVRVLNTRPLEAPSLDQVRDGIRRSLERERRQAIMETLFDEADIEPMLPLEEQ